MFARLLRGCSEAVFARLFRGCTGAVFGKIVVKFLQCCWEAVARVRTFVGDL